MLRKQREGCWRNSGTCPPYVHVRLPSLTHVHLPSLTHVHLLAVC